MRWLRAEGGYLVYVLDLGLWFFWLHVEGLRVVGFLGIRSGLGCFGLELETRIVLRLLHHHRIHSSILSSILCILHHLEHLKHLHHLLLIVVPILIRHHCHHRVETAIGLLVWSLGHVGAEATVGVLALVVGKAFGQVVGLALGVVIIVARNVFLSFPVLFSFPDQIVGIHLSSAITSSRESISYRLAWPFLLQMNRKRCTTPNNTNHSSQRTHNNAKYGPPISFIPFFFR